MNWLTEFKLDKSLYDGCKIVLNNNKEEESCVFYWYEDPKFLGDINKGYVGVSTNYEYRINGRKRLIDDIKYTSSTLINAIRKYRVEPIILLESTLKICLEIENYLRPKENIGWNQAIGGGYPPKTTKETTNKHKKFWEDKGLYLGYALNTSDSVNKRMKSREVNNNLKGLSLGYQLSTPESVAKRSKKVYLYTFYGNLVKEFPSQNSLGRFLNGVPYSYINTKYILSNSLITDITSFKNNLLEKCSDKTFLEIDKCNNLIKILRPKSTYSKFNKLEYIELRSKYNSFIPIKHYLDTFRDYPVREYTRSLVENETTHMGNDIVPTLQETVSSS